MKTVCNPDLLGIFNTEFSDIIQPILLKMDKKWRRRAHPFNEGPYEPGNFCVKKGDVVFDCGANVGLFSLMAATRDCTCYAFEPMLENIASLKELIQLNPHIILAPYAVCDHNGTLLFSNNQGSLNANKIETEGDKGDSITVDCVTLDSFAEANQLSRVDFIKADIEGAERLLLKGAKNILKKYAPKISICTYHLSDDPQVLRNLILEANPNYIIKERYKKMYAYVPK